MGQAAIVGWTSLALAAVYMVPQIVKVVRTQQSGDLSIPTYGIQFVSCSLFTYYNVLTHQPILVIMGGIQLTQLVLLVGLSYHYGGRDKAAASVNTVSVPTNARQDLAGCTTSGAAPRTGRGEVSVGGPRVETCEVTSGGGLTVVATAV